MSKQTPEQVQKERTKVAISVINAADAMLYSMTKQRLDSSTKCNLYDAIHDSIHEITKDYIQCEKDFMENHIGTPFIPYDK